MKQEAQVGGGSLSVGEMCMGGGASGQGLNVQGLRPGQLCLRNRPRENQTLVHVERTDINPSYTPAMGKRAQHEWNASSPCREVTACFKRESEGVGGEGTAGPGGESGK